MVYDKTRKAFTESYSFVGLYLFYKYLISNLLIGVRRLLQEVMENASLI